MDPWGAAASTRSTSASVKALFAPGDTTMVRVPALSSSGACQIRTGDPEEAVSPGIIP